MQIAYVNLLILFTVLLSYKKKSLSLVSKNQTIYILKYLGIERNNVCNLLSNLSGKMSERECVWGNRSECKYLVNLGKGHIGGVLCTIFLNLHLKLQHNLKVTKS